MTTEQQERRAGGRERIPFEALVVVNGAGGKQPSGGAFECESVNVSMHGMLLRTAYLPPMGESLSCRFDTGTGEVEARGTVVWRNEQAKGGEFGVAFGALDDAAAQALRALSGVSEPPTSTTQPAESATLGARVRLHIEGLGSPMRARVRQTETGAVMVGSNLDFLRVGRTIELEDLDQGSKRAAVVETVGVETDAVSNVPQLTVRLRYADNPSTVRATAETREPTLSADAPEALHEASGQGLLATLRERATRLVSVLGPRIEEAAIKAREALGNVTSRVHARSIEGDDNAPPMRTTTAAPEGGLMATGRRVVRESREATTEEASDAVVPARVKKPGRRLALVGGAMAAVGALCLVALKPSASQPPHAETASVAGTDAASGHAETPGAKALPANASDVVTARVPLFGATPLSTTEAAMVPTPQAAAIMNGPSAPPTVAGPTPTVLADANEGESKDSAAAHYGKGAVKNAHIVRLKMDAPITDIKGSVNGAAISLVLPGRHNAEAATTLVKRDKRLSSVKTTPKGDGTEVTFTFSDDVPPFLAKANGRVLELALGESLTTDDASHSHKRHAKKGTAHAAHRDAIDEAKKSDGAKHSGSSHDTKTSKKKHAE